jgi:outer membrane immunogenic protein
MVGWRHLCRADPKRPVIGLEGDIDWTNIKGSGTGPVTRFGVLNGTATLSSTVSSISTIRTRVGYAQDNWLFYGTGGLAVTDASSTFTQTVGFACGAAVPCSSKTGLHPGLAAGAGVEYGFTPNLSAKLEYMWIGAGAGNTLHENMVRVGLNYRFGGN